MSYTGAEIVIQTLLRQGVDTVFGYPGSMVIDLFDALESHKRDIRLILPAHEQGGAFAADGYARVSGRTGVMIATSGPGATNLVTGLADAFMDSVPLVAITGNVPSRLIGRDAFQEVDISGVSMPVTKHSYIVRDRAALADTVREAFVIANSGRPGPVLIDIPKDILETRAEGLPGGPFIRRSTPKPDMEQIQKAVALLARSQRPLILCGGGVIRAGAAGALLRLAEQGRLPVTTTLQGLSALPRKHPLMLGLTGMHGTPVSLYARETCDLLLCVGSRFSDRVTGKHDAFAPEACRIHCDIDPSEFDKNVSCDLHLWGDAKEILETLADRLPARGEGPWLQELSAHRDAHPYPHVREDAQDGASPLGPPPMRSDELLHLVAKSAGPDAVVVTDVGQHQMWTAQFYPFERPGSFVTSGGLGAMGFGLGAAVGVKAAYPDRPVVLITGDGSFHMNVAELSTAVTENLPVVVLVMNNGVLGMVRQWQTLLYGGRHAGTTTHRRTDFPKVAGGFGALGFRAESYTEAEEALRAAFASKQTCVVECPIDAREMVYAATVRGRNGNAGGEDR